MMVDLHCNITYYGPVLNRPSCYQNKMYNIEISPAKILLLDKVPFLPFDGKDADDDSL